MKTEQYTDDAMRSLHAFLRYQTHGGYSWAAVTSDGETLCTSCVRDNFHEIYRATRDPHDRSGWRIIGLANSGEAECTEFCVHCNEPVWTIDDSE